jgi:ribonucrease Y
MTPNMMLLAMAALFIGTAIPIIYFRLTQSKRFAELETHKTQLLDSAKLQAENERSRLLLEAKERILAIRKTVDQEIAEERKQLSLRELKLDRRDEALHANEENLRQVQASLQSNQARVAEQTKVLSAKQSQIEQLGRRQQEELQRVSGLTREEASQQLLKSLSSELENEMGSMLLKHRSRLDEVSKQQGREILLTAIQRFASAHTADSTTSTVDVPTDEMKGRIIGREGRNVRAFEKETGVDVIIDDTPGVVIVSSFDPIRREVARISLEKLIADGRIHPSKIEETVAETTKEVEDVILTKGRQAADEVNVPGLNEKVLSMLGRLHFRTSYSQNVLRHSIEVAFVAGLVAEMLGMDGDLARRCGLLHDIGKAADHELEGGHPKIGADFLRRNGEGVEVVHAALGHHDDIVTEYPFTMLTAIGDACSASRPGARRESLERYVKRMEELESIAKRFEGVKQAFAISAGRELRVIVNSHKTTDAEAATICRNIAKAFESELTYPGEIKVTVLRESRFSETAK